MAGAGNPNMVGMTKPGMALAAPAAPVAPVAPTIPSQMSTPFGGMFPNPMQTMPQINRGPEVGSAYSPMGQPAVRPRYDETGDEFNRAMERNLRPTNAQTMPAPPPMTQLPPMNQPMPAPPSIGSPIPGTGVVGPRPPQIRPPVPQAGTGGGKGGGAPVVTPPDGLSDPPPGTGLNLTSIKLQQMALTALLRERLASLTISR